MHTQSHTVMRVSVSKRIWAEITGRPSPKCTLDLRTESMNNRVAETNRRVACSAPTDRKELCVSRDERRRTRWATSVLHQRNRTCFVSFSASPPIFIHPNGQKHTFSQLMFLETAQISPCLLSDSLFHFAISAPLPESLFVCLYWSGWSSCVGPCMGLKDSCFPWQPCHFLLNILALAIGESQKKLE